MSYNNHSAGKFLAALALSMRLPDDAPTSDRVAAITAAMRVANGQLPVAGIPARVVNVDGVGPVNVYVAPLPPHPDRKIPGYRVRKRSGHRLLCECPNCGIVVSCGRLHQHMGTAKCATRAASR